MDYLDRIHCSVFSDIIQLSPTLLTPAVSFCCLFPLYSNVSAVTGNLVNLS